MELNDNNKIQCEDSLEFLKKQPDFFFDINYSDPPYALGSEIIIKNNGKVDYKGKASDFMNKWDMPNGVYWEEWFKEAYRTLKYGGYLIMFGMDRQLLLFKYYASLSGFQERQSLYWYFISNFPKASDLSKNLDKNAGTEREIIGKDPEAKRRNKINSPLAPKDGWNKNNMLGECDITAPSTNLAKKYNGYKYSISPLKQTNETIMIFQKPYKTKSCLHDTLSYEKGNKECCCGALNIEECRVGTNKIVSTKGLGEHKNMNDDGWKGIGKRPNSTTSTGRYPAQTFIGGINLTIMCLKDKIDKGIKQVIIDYYDKLYLQSVREKVLSTTFKNKKREGEVLFKEMLLGDIKNNNGREKSSELWKTEKQENNRKNKENLEEEGKNERILPCLEGWNNNDEGLCSNRLSELSEKELEDIEENERERQKNFGTQSNNGNLFEKTIKENRDSPSQERNKERQQTGEFRANNKGNALKNTQGIDKRIERKEFIDRTTAEKNIYVEKENIPDGWLNYFDEVGECYYGAGEVLDKQSGIKKPSGCVKGTEPSKTRTENCYSIYNRVSFNAHKDTAGCSKILHKCDFEKDEHDLYLYCPKVSKKERNAGLNKFEEKVAGSMQANEGNTMDLGGASLKGKHKQIQSKRNIHPTLKPISLNQRILKLFKTPNPQKIIYPFAGVFSEIIGGYKAGFNDYCGCELNEEYITIGNARLKYHTNNDLKKYLKQE